MEKKFHFTPPFLESLKETLDEMSSKLNVLNTLSDGFTDSLGVYHCSYTMRYITPSDVATYISNVHKGMLKQLIGANAYDTEMFSVESVKRIMTEHGCKSFDDAGCMGNSFDGQRHETMQDLLLVHSNTVYNNVVCTPYEQKQRLDELKNGDLKVINDMHFVANIKKIVDQFPDMIEKMEDAEFYTAQPLVGKMFRAIVEEFIIFACTVNMITVCDMVDYCVPSATFNTKYDSDGDGDEILQEAVDLKTSSPIYFVFAQGQTRFISNAIKKVTKSPFSHISISFDEKLNPMYSFGGKIENDTYTNERKGVRKEDIGGNYYKNIDVDVYAAYLPNEMIDKIKSVCDDYIKNANKTSFDYGILLTKLVKKDGVLPKDKYRQVCSTFVNQLFKSVDINVSDKNIPSPAELKDSFDVRESKFFKVYSGKASEYKSSDISSKVHDIAEKAGTHTINEYTTECCMLKTNTMCLNSQIPFNCNMRNVVLNDTTPTFSNTYDAVKFIMNDNRSPIHKLLVDNATLGRADYGIEMIKQAFLTHHKTKWGLDTTPFDRYNERTSFHSDPGWFDKIVYGTQYLDGDYRRDNPGNHHYHSIEFDISTIYRMFSCHHNDNEHLANNIVKVGNIMCRLIDDYRRHQDSAWENIRDILATFGEILTKSMLMLYHNNNRAITYTDSMNDTMIPGYMYCESFVMEADEKQTTDNSNIKQPTIENKSTLKDPTTKQKIVDKVRSLIEKFLKYVREVVANIFPKFVSAHKAEQKWISDHQNLHTEIAEALDNKKFVIDINDYREFNVPADKLGQVKQKAEDMSTKIKNPDELSKLGDTKQAIAKQLVYDEVAKKLNDNFTDKDLMQATSEFIMFGGNENGNVPAGETKPLDSKMFNDLRDNIWGDKSINKVIENGSKDSVEALNKLMTAAKDELEKAKRNSPSNNNDNNDKTDNPNDTSNTATLQRVVDGIMLANQGSWMAGLRTCMNDVYGKSYNLYRSIIIEYQRQKDRGVESTGSNDNTEQTTGEKNESTPGQTAGQ